MNKIKIEIEKRQMAEVSVMVDEIMNITPFQQRMVVVEIMKRIDFRDSKITW